MYDTLYHSLTCRTDSRVNFLLRFVSCLLVQFNEQRWERYCVNETHYKIPHTVHVEGRNTSGSLAVKTIGRRPDGTQISQVREKFHSKSSTAALGIITKLLLSVKTGSYLNPKPSKMPLIVCNAQFWFSFLFPFLSPSFLHSFYILTVTAEGCQELGGAEPLPKRMHIKGTSWKCAICPAWPGLFCYPVDNVHVQ